MNSTEEMMLDENELDSISKLAYELHHEWPEISLAEMELATNEGLWVIFLKLIPKAPGRRLPWMICTYWSLSCLVCSWNKPAGIL